MTFCSVAIDTITNTFLLFISLLLNTVIPCNLYIATRWPPLHFEPHGPGIGVLVFSIFLHNIKYDKSSVMFTIKLNIFGLYYKVIQHADTGLGLLRDCVLVLIIPVLAVLPVELASSACIISCYVWCWVWAGLTIVQVVHMHQAPTF